MEKAGHGAQGPDLVPVCPPESGKQTQSKHKPPGNLMHLTAPHSTVVMLHVSLHWTSGICMAEPG